MPQCPHCLKITDKEENLIGVRLLFYDKAQGEWIVKDGVQKCPICDDIIKVFSWKDYLNRDNDS